MTADQSPPTADLAPLSEARLAEIRAHVSRSEYTRDMHALLPSSPSAFLSGRPDRSGKTRTAGACTRKDTRGSVTARSKDGEKVVKNEPRPCVVCGRIFTQHQSKKRPTARYCSTPCRTATGPGSYPSNHATNARTFGITKG